MKETKIDEVAKYGTLIAGGHLFCLLVSFIEQEVQMKEGSKIADEIISDWNREKYLKKLSERIKKGRDKDGRSILCNRPSGND